MLFPWLRCWHPGERNQKATVSRTGLLSPLSQHGLRPGQAAGCAQSPNLPTPSPFPEESSMAGRVPPPPLKHGTAASSAAARAACSCARCRKPFCQPCCEAGYPPLETCCQERSRSRTRSSSVSKAMSPQTAAPRASAGTGRTPQTLPALPHAVRAAGAIFLEETKNNCMKVNSKQDLEARKSVQGYPRITGLGRV